MAHELHDVAIIGAGPCGLAVAARLRETLPSALFTDSEHQRYHWIRRHAERDRVTIRTKKKPVVRPNNNNRQTQLNTIKMVAFEATSDQWLSRWHGMFEALKIRHLRSPLFFHVDPQDRDSLLAFAHERGRMGEMREITGVVGKEISKHERKKKMRSNAVACRRCMDDSQVAIDERARKDYFNPSSALFRDHCDEMVRRYSLADLVMEARVESLGYGHVEGVGDGERVFTLGTSSGTYHSRTVVLANGGTGPNIPEEMPACCCHSSQLVNMEFPPKHIKRRRKAGEVTNIMVVGGGLTSAQIADLAVSRGVSKVWHIMRGPLKVKPFDVDLSWIGKYKNVQKSVFWSSDELEARLQMIAHARNGGSITPEYVKVLRHHIATGHVSLHTHTILVSSTYDATAQKHCVVTDPPIPSLPHVDFIIYCTGMAADLSALPFLQPLRAKFRWSQLGGLPTLTEELALREDLPCFVTGRLAACRLGPGAGNLEGAREGAERVSWGVREWLGKEPHVDGRETVDMQLESHNRYDCLATGE